jgi:type VI secretion system secreted protein Hcp
MGRLPLKVLLPTVAALGAGAAIAVGSIPGSGGTISGCYVTATSTAGSPAAVVPPQNPGILGSLRIIDAENSQLPAVQRSCLINETPISWNQQGPQGLPGAAGVPGVAGAGGAPGAQGVPGTLPSPPLQFSAGGHEFLDIPGIEGESTDAKHKGEITISTFSIGGGGGTGKVNVHDLTITKSVDKSSPKLFQSVATGKHFSQVVLTVAKLSHGVNHDYLRFTFSDVLVSGQKQPPGPPEHPVEQDSLRFGTLKQEFIPSGGAKPITITIAG